MSKIWMRESNNDNDRLCDNEQDRILLDNNLLVNYRDTNPTNHNLLKREDNMKIIYSVQDGNWIVAYFFDKSLAQSYVKQAKKDCKYNTLQIIKKTGQRNKDNPVNKLTCKLLKENEILTRNIENLKEENKKLLKEIQDLHEAIEWM